MFRLVLRVFVFLLVLIPSAQFAWRNRDMPEFAYLHDDGVMLVSAQSLAAGNGSSRPMKKRDLFMVLQPLFRRMERRRAHAR